MEILLVSGDEDKKDRLSRMIEDMGYQAPMRACSGKEATDVMADLAVNLVIVDQMLPDTSGMEFVKKLVMINPMANTMLFSDLSSEDFHEATEGLGLLGKIPLTFSLEDIEKLFNQLAEILRLSQVKPAGGQS